MGIERVSEVKPPEHWIGALQLVAQASGGDHSHSSAFDRLDLCLISIEQSSAMIVFGPPDPVTGMDRQPLLLAERKAIVLRTWTDPARPKGSCLTLAVLEENPAPLLVVPVHRVFPPRDRPFCFGVPTR